MRPEKLKEMNEIDWWHKINLGEVKNKPIITPGRDNSDWKLSILELPKSLEGKSVIDVGAWDGFFSFECEKRGAESVLAIDTNEWNEFTDNHGRFHTGKKGFDFAHKILRSKVNSKEIEVMDLINTTRDYDLVLCLGILYHMEDPFGMCKAMYHLCSDEGMLILETHIDCMEIKDKAVSAFYSRNQCNDDPSNWFGPNPKCVAEMLKAAGFEDVKMVFSDEKINRGVFHAWKKKNGKIYYQSP